MGAVIIFIIDRKIRATHAFFTILFLLICLSAAPAFGNEAIAPSDSPKTTHYIKHGVPRIRTGLSTEDEWSTLAGPIQPGGEPLLKYKPSEGYDIKALGLTIKPSYTLILQGTPDPNLPPGSGKFGASWNLYLDFAKKIEDYGLIFCQIMSGWGETVAPDLKLFSNVNCSYYDIGGRIKARRYYYEQYLYDKSVTLRVGMFKAADWFDQNNCEDDSDKEFLNDAFNSSPAVDWPSSWGTTFAEYIEAFVPGTDFLELSAAHFEGNADYQQMFEHGLYIAQATIRTDKLFGFDPKNWMGHYRAYGWVNNRTHSKYAAQGEITGPGDYINYGFGVSIDQKIDPYIFIFGRLGWQRPDVIPASGGANVEWTWSTGLQVNGCYWKRPNDHFAFAVGQDFVSKNYINAGNAGANEGHIEVYYAWKMNPCLTLSPDLQLIWNPHGVSQSCQGDAEPVFVYGGRLNLVF